MGEFYGHKPQGKLLRLRFFGRRRPGGLGKSQQHLGFEQV